MSNSKIVFITGATAGIGRTTALHLATLGHHVIASGRKATELAKLETEAKGLAGKLDTITLDAPPRAPGGAQRGSRGPGAAPASSTRSRSTSRPGRRSRRGWTRSAS